MLKNTYEVHEDYAIIITQKQERIIVDNNKLEELKKYRWFVNGKGYVICNITVNGKQKKMKLHRFIINAPDHSIVDHKDKNKLNNQLSNLRIVSSVESNQNNVKRKDNTSGVTGVIWERKKKMWRAFIYINSKRKHILITKDKERAICARLKAELEYYGKDFAPQRELFEKYGIAE